MFSVIDELEECWVLRASEETPAISQGPLMDVGGVWDGMGWYDESG